MGETEKRGITEIKGKVRTIITAYVAEKQPFGKILGQPFLEKHSPAFKQMCREFPEEMLSNDQAIACPASLQDRLLKKNIG